MFAKLLVVIITIGACACVLLGARQARIVAAHELAEARLRLARHDNDLYRLRAEIASLAAPDRVRRIAGAIRPLRPVGPDALAESLALRLGRAWMAPIPGDAPGAAP